ncbi:MAG: hypothetical protein ACI857_002445, partial [Arenicella sp.]
MYSFFSTLKSNFMTYLNKAFMLAFITLLPNIFFAQE